MRTVLLLFVTTFLAVAATAQDYTVTLFFKSTVGSAELNPGDCKLTLDDNHVLIRQGRKKVEAEVQVETANEKFKRTSVRYKDKEGKRHISEIELRGTNTKLIFN